MNATKLQTQSPEDNVSTSRKCFRSAWLLCSRLLHKELTLQVSVSLTQLKIRYQITTNQ